jgi:hypothetical protein
MFSKKWWFLGVDFLVKRGVMPIYREYWKGKI